MAKVRFLYLNEDPGLTSNRNLIQETLDTAKGHDYVEIQRVHGVYRAKPTDRRRRLGHYAGGIELMKTYRVSMLRKRLSKLR